MAFIVKQLIEGHADPVTVRENAPLQEGLDLMIEHSYSQLPVVNEHRQPLGMITSDSILKTLSYFSVSINDLKVSASAIKVPHFRSEDDLIELLRAFNDFSASLIVDGNNRLTAIVTDYDIARYFRREAEGKMLIEDIETTLKDHIFGTCSDVTGETDQTALSDAIDNVTHSMKSKQNKFEKALRFYIGKSSNSGKELNSVLVKEAFSLIEKKKQKEFKELTLKEKFLLLVYMSKKHQDNQLFGMPSKAIQRLFEDVVETRNDLFHFRDEISNTQRDQLKLCSDMLNRHLSIKEVSKGTVSIPVINFINDNLTDEELVPEDSRYALLALWLQSQSTSHESITLTFEQIEGVIKSPLPSSARIHISWWVNDPDRHVQSQQWLEVGWRVSFIKINEERVTFTRIKGREKAYIEFFSTLLSELSAIAPFHLNKSQPDGLGWVHVFYFPEDKKQIPLSYSFARGRRLRIELYINVGNQEKNKQIYDELYSHKSNIEEKAGEELSWERLSEKQPSRIALYHDGAITDKQEQLDQLRRWAVDAMIRFYNAITGPVSTALSQK